MEDFNAPLVDLKEDLCFFNFKPKPLEIKQANLDVIHAKAAPRQSKSQGRSLDQAKRQMQPAGKQEKKRKKRKRRETGDPVIDLESKLQSANNMNSYTYYVSLQRKLMANRGKTASDAKPAEKRSVAVKTETSGEKFCREAKEIGARWNALPVTEQINYSTGLQKYKKVLRDQLKQLKTERNVSENMSTKQTS